MSEEEADIEWETPRRDPDDVRALGVGAVLLGALAVFALAVGATWLQLQHRQAHLNPAGSSVPSVLGQAEINLVNQAPFVLDTRAYEQRERERRVLHGYGWVDRERGLVHIPIERAIQQVVEEQRAGGEGERP